jgi:hypothetical protein
VSWQMRVPALLAKELRRDRLLATRLDELRNRLQAKHRNSGMAVRPMISRHRKKPNSIRRMITEIGTPSNQRRIGMGFPRARTCVKLCVEPHFGMTPQATRPLPPPFSGLSV